METELSELDMTRNQEHGETGTSHHVSIEISEEEIRSISSMEDRLKENPRLLIKSAGKISCCIFRVPQSLVEMNEKAYYPHVVSIGPYHCGKENLKMIQEHKWRFLGSILDRTRVHGVDLKELIKVVASMEERIRGSYSEAITLTSSELTEMMVLDGCFIVELFCVVGRLVKADIDDPIFNMSWIFYFLIRDLLRLENQIPFFVLQALFERVISSTKRNNVPSLTELALGFFDYALERPVEILEKFNNITGKHLLDLFRSSFILSTPELPRKNGPFLQLIPSAQKLHKAGVRFRPREKADSFLDIKFKKGLLEIPPLTIDDFTSAVLLNCIAYEQCYSHCSNHVTSYITFMGCLMNTPADSGFLCDHYIIENYFGADDEIARFFNNVGKDVAFDIRRSHLSILFENINEYYSDNWHVRWASFKHTYFNSPWSFLSALAASTLLLLTLLQSFFIVYSYIRPPH